MDDPVLSGDVDTVWLSVGHVPLVQTDSERLPESPEVVTDLKGTCEIRRHFVRRYMIPR